MILKRKAPKNAKSAQGEKVSRNTAHTQPKYMILLERCLPCCVTCIILYISRLKFRTQKCMCAVLSELIPPRSCKFKANLEKHTWFKPKLKPPKDKSCNFKLALINYLKAPKNALRLNQNEGFACG